MISIENLSKGYGGNLLLDKISFKVNPKERVGLVGRNGHGKTTLMRIITGEESADEGRIVFPRNYKIGYVRQHLGFTQPTVLGEVASGLDAEHEWRAKKILSGLGFSDADMQRGPEEFSGGFQVRMHLAKVLVSEPDMLLLDEPTNYLDITSIRWLEGFLKSWPRELMLITHDRGFMDNVITHTIGIHRKQVKKIAGSTDKLYEQLSKEEEIYEKTRLNEEAKRKEIEQFITRFRSKANLASRVQSRVKKLDRMGSMNRLEEIKDLEFSFRHKPYKGKQLMQVKDVSFGYSDDLLFKNLSFTLGSEDRVCIIGPNGRGKTTLLKVLAGKLKPVSGEVSFSPGINFGLYEQTNVSHLDPRRTVEDEIGFAAPDMERTAVRSICGAMMFEGDNALKKVSVLSGGEKSRVMLGKVLAVPVNIVMLDEPTNHLDMQSCDGLLEAVDSFPGAVIMITHNEMFLHAVADKLIVFQGGRAEYFDGTYQEFLDKGGWENEENKRLTPAEKVTKKDLRKARSEIVSERSKAVKPLEEAVIRLEGEISTWEEKLAAANDALVEASSAQDAEKIRTCSQAIHEAEEKIEVLFAELESATEAFEAKRAEFDARLAELEG